MQSNATSGEIPKSIRHLDVWEFCRRGNRIAGELTGAGIGNNFPRFAESQLSQNSLHWQAEGFCDKDGRCSLRLSGRFHARQECMRCGSAVEQEVGFNRLLRLCKSEQEADTLDTDEDEDAVAAPGKVDVVQWLEDEMLLSLPMFPVHEGCAADDGASDGLTDTSEKQTEQERSDKVHRPFEQLAGLLKSKPEKS